MSVLPYIQANEAVVGKGHASLTDTLNRALRAVLTASGLDPDASFPGFLPAGSPVIIYPHLFPGTYASDKIIAAINSVKVGGLLPGPLVVDCRWFSGQQQYLTSTIVGTVLAQTDNTPITWLWGPHTYFCSGAQQYIHSHHHHVLNGTTFTMKDTGGARVTGQNGFHVRAAIDLTTVTITNGSATATLSNATYIEQGSCIAIPGHQPRGGRDTAAIVGAHTNVVTTLTVDSTAAFESSGNLMLAGGERVSYTSKDATHFLGCTRGAFGTTAISYVGAEVIDRAVYDTYFIDTLNGLTATLDRPAVFSGSGLPIIAGAYDWSIEGVGTIDGNKNPGVDDALNPHGVVGFYSRRMYIAPSITFSNWDHGGVGAWGWMDGEVNGIGVNNGQPTLLLGASFWFFQCNKRMTGRLRCIGGYGGVIVDDRSVGPARYDNACEDITVEVWAYNCALSFQSGGSFRVNATLHDAVGYTTYAMQLTADQWNFGSVPNGCRFEVRSAKPGVGATNVLTAAAAYANGGNVFIVPLYNLPFSVPAGNMVVGFRARVAQAVAGAGTAVPNLALGHIHIITVNGATWTMGAPINSYPDADVEVEVFNNTAGAITTTWNAVYKLTGWVEPAAGKRKSIVFRKDEATGNFIQKGGISGDI